MARCFLAVFINSQAGIELGHRLEAEHSKHKGMYADLALENDALKELIEKSSEANRTPPSGGLVCE
jgi:hypothetical protein